ncbi:hypothetical protein [Brevibacillus sp. NSP2.1]|uniref:hypothetical protein n=1 Tax=Brevibacillus sp. NSP2.1 TaxID=3003229 RepID=UPI0003FE3EFA|nr:hypothetical protein [Brevibacillus sp. NSP2.1]
MVTIYTIKTPNAQYNGITEGVPFVNGVAEVKDEATRNVLVNNYGYIDATGDTPEPKTEEPEAPAKPARKSSAK